MATEQVFNGFEVMYLFFPKISTLTRINTDINKLEFAKSIILAFFNRLCDMVSL